MALYGERRPEFRGQFGADRRGGGHDGGGQVPQRQRRYHQQEGRGTKVRGREPRIAEIFPPIEETLELEPEDLAPFVLKYLKQWHESASTLNKHNFTSCIGPEYEEYAGEHREELGKRFMEAWVWLEREIFIAEQPGIGGSDLFFITRRGKRILEEQDFASYQKGQLLPSENLDPILVRKVKPLFIRGDYDSAVFQALKEVEIRVRKKAGYGNDKTGVSLMRAAFKPATGPLIDGCLESGEQEAIGHFFAGAMGVFRNPVGHRDVEYADPNEVADIIHIANQLLRICERCGVQQSGASG